MADDETKLAAPRRIQRDGDRFTISLPEEAVVNSGLTMDDETMVAYRDDGPIVLLPWAREDVVELFREDRDEGDDDGGADDGGADDGGADDWGADDGEVDDGEADDGEVHVDPVDDRTDE